MQKIKRNVYKVGVALFVKKNGKFQREARLFSHRSEAESYAKSHYSKLEFRVQGVRLDATPLQFASNREDKAKTHG